MFNASTGSAEFLLDAEFYHHIARRFYALCGGGADIDAVRGEQVLAEPPGAYILIGLWRCDPRTPIGAPATDTQPEVPSRTMTEWLTLLDQQQVHVGLVLWQGTRISHGVRCHQNSLAIEQHARGLEFVHVFREAYGGALEGRSTHQKLLVFWDGVALEAVVGGFNLHPHFFFRLDHGPLNAAGADDGEGKNNLWHDTAVALRGPVALIVQQEWERRWNKSPAPAHFLATIHGLAPQTPCANPYPIEIATTNTEGGAGETDIRAQVVAAIAAAQTSIYMENYALNDPAILTALTTAMRANPALNVIIVVNHPQSTNIEGNEAWAYLMWYTFVEFALVQPTSIRAHVMEPLDIISYMAVPDVPVLRQLDAADFDFDVQDAAPSILPLRHRAAPEFIRLYYRLVSWTHRGGDAQRNGSDYVHNLKNIDGRRVMYSPRRRGAGQRYWPYVHSKLAIFDEQVAFVGSANWTTRSMELDGEMTAIIRHPATVAAMAARLCSHWSPGVTIANWHAHWAGATEAGGAAGSVWMERLAFEHFIHPEAVGWSTVLLAAWYKPHMF